MAQGQITRHFYFSSTLPGKIGASWGFDAPAGDQEEGQSEALIDALIRFSLLAWRTEIDTHPPRWSQVQDRIFSELKNCRNAGECR